MNTDYKNTPPCNFILLSILKEDKLSVNHMLWTFGSY